MCTEEKLIKIVNKLLVYYKTSWLWKNEDKWKIFVTRHIFIYKYYRKPLVSNEIENATNKPTL